MSWEEITRAVYEMIVSSKMVVDSLNRREVSKYEAVMVPREEVANLGLGMVIPKRTIGLWLVHQGPGRNV